jgi:excisionase family DNA binding protein
MAYILASSIFIRGAIVPDDTTWLTIDDIYELLDKKVPKDTIRSWIRSKRLPAYKPARAILVKREDLEKFLKESRTKPDEAT